MKKLLCVGALVAAGLLLTACAPSLQSAEDKCGGTEAGMSVKDATLHYDQDDDSTGDAWTCLLGEFVPKESVQYAITQDMEPGKTGTAFVDQTSIVYGVKQSGAVILSVQLID